MSTEATSSAVIDEFDVLIVGGGMVGASLALSLATLPITVAVIEAVPPASGANTSFDTRTTALANGSRNILHTLGVWDAISLEATPIHKIHVSERGRFGSAVIDATQQGIAAMGYVVHNHVLGRALWQRLAREPSITLLTPARVSAMRTEAACVELQVEHDGVARTVRARLVVAADGADSLVRCAAGIKAEQWPYEQTAVITTVTPERLHQNIAYERFTDSGPIAMLPMAGARVGVVYALQPAAAAEVMALDDGTFLKTLQAAFGWRLGRLTQVSARHAYPLALTRAAAQVAARVAVVGNASQGLHPIAGQGFNLGLRDVITLAEVIADALIAEPMSGDTVDVGTAEVLARYVAWRASDRRALVGFTDGLVRLFGSPWQPVRALRGVGLLLFDLSPTAKTALSRLSLGFASHMPRLARGVPLPTRSTRSAHT